MISIFLVKKIVSFRTLLKGFFSLNIIFLSSNSFSETESLYFTKNSRSYDFINTSILQKGLAHACLGVIVQDAIPCNPAWVSLQNIKKLSMNGLISNGASSVKTIHELLNNPLSENLLNTLFRDQNVTQIESHINLTFKSNLLNGTYMPQSIKGLIAMRNEANPDVEVLASEDKNLTLQYGQLLWAQLYGGLQLRFFESKFLKKRFKLVELAAESQKNFFLPSKINAIYLEPGLLWFLSEKMWNSRLSFFLRNGALAGSSNINEPSLNLSPEFSWTVEPPLTWGKAEVSLEYRNLTGIDTDAEPLHLGFLYTFGTMSISTGVDFQGASTGIYFELENINAGILYSTTRFLSSSEDFFTDTVYVQLGWQI